jgi:GNAT superfamily N-acetyltransferase
VNISIATTNDISKLCTLLDSLFDQEADFAPDKQAQTKGLSAIINSNETGDILVARDAAGEIVGMVNLLFTVSTALGGRVAILEDLVVSCHRRGQGIGSRLINSARKHALERGCLRITLLTDTDNIKAHGFYKKHGFNQSSMITFRMLLDDNEPR